MHPHYQLGIDLGTTWTAASICREGAARPESVALGTASAAVASVVFLAPDGTMLTGDPAARRALSEPGRVVREFKRRIGDGTPLVVAGRPVPAEVLSARFVARVVAEVAHREDGPAEAVAVTHPVEWGEHKRRAFADALDAEGLPDVLFLTEPQAAAIGYASAERIEAGRTVAVYDLGGGTFDAAVRPQGRRRRSSCSAGPRASSASAAIDFDDGGVRPRSRGARRRAGRLDPDDPSAIAAVGRLRRECAQAKEALSADTEVVDPGAAAEPAHRGAAEPRRVRGHDPAVAVRRRSRRCAGPCGRPGCARSELRPRAAGRRLVADPAGRADGRRPNSGRPVAVDADPKAVVAAGAALAARALHAPAPAADDPTSEEPASPPLAFDAAPSTAAAAAPRRPRDSGSSSPRE